jgi:LmbE family N-acetylglucosaminyl deacetylase
MREKLSELLLRSVLRLYRVRLIPCVETPARSNVVVLAPHIDDETIGCGGTLRQHVMRADDVTVIFVTDGSLSSGVADLAARREAEAEEAVRQILGVNQLIFWRYPDRGLSASPDARLRLETVLKELEPDILYVPSAWDQHPDHIATAQLLDTSAGYVHRSIRVYEVFCPLTPKLVNCSIDISTVFDLKVRATHAFRTQHVSFSSALMLNHIHSELAHQPNVRAVELFLELSPAHYERANLLLANARRRPRQVLNYRNMAQAYLVNLICAGSIAAQMRNSG